MNEIELLRIQLATERRHVREVAASCAAAARGVPSAPAGSAPEAWRQACTEYLGCVLEWFDERDARLLELYDRKAVAALGDTGQGREALERLAAASASHSRWQDLERFINGPWDARRAAVDALLATNPRVADWRAFGGIDADSICRERVLYARCLVSG